jgi:hypothetical protein
VCAMTAWTRGNLGCERDVDAGKMGRQRSAVGAPFLPLGIGRGFRGVFLVLLRILLGDRRLDILQRQLHLLVIKPLGPPPKLRALKLPQEVAKPTVLLPHAPAFFYRRVALARQAAHQQASRSSGRVSIGIIELESDSCMFGYPTRNLDKSQLSRGRCRPRNIPCVQTRPIHPVNECRKLRRRQPHHAVTHRWPPEGAMLQPFPEQN